MAITEMLIFHVLLMVHIDVPFGEIAFSGFPVFKEDVSLVLTGLHSL